MATDMNIKKAVILNGSAKKEESTTLSVTQAFVKGLCSRANVDCEYINIADLNIKPCMGCLSCWGRTEGTCVIRDDDIAAIKNKILSADYVIESYPLYFFGMPGIMKVFTDRMLSMLKTYVGQSFDKNSSSSVHGIRRHRAGQKLILISSCAYSDSEFVYDSLLTQYDFICGKGNYTAILCPQLQTMAKLGTPARWERYLKKFEDAGAAFAVEGKLTDEQLQVLAQPPFSQETYRVLLDKFWESQKRGDKV